MKFKHIQSIVFDFDGVFTDNTVVVDQNGIESVRCWRSDGLGLDRLRALGLKLLIISTEVNPVVSVRAKKLKVECFQGICDKAEAILKWTKDNNVDLSKTAFVGNDINDIAAFKEVGFAIAVADCYDEVKPYVKFQLSKPGGYGAVREICDLIYNDYQTLSSAVSSNTSSNLEEV
ncbi:HAD hydrolase family protein [Pedobacter sp. P351]|uniref:KdsC family phosphatase n=1 Tax=Pedobacter superstes TaxID=3133441 RepID=UPI00309FC609